MDSETADGVHFTNFMRKLREDVSDPAIQQRLRELDEIADMWVFAAECRAVARHGAQIMATIHGRTFANDGDKYIEPEDWASQ
jgi:hypothetical protein